MPLSAASADGSEAEFSGDGALTVPATASVAWVLSAANREGMVGYTHPTIRERGSGQMMSAATVPLVPLSHGLGGRRVGAGRRPTARSVDKNGTELAETDLHVFGATEREGFQIVLGRGLVALRGVRGLSFAREAGTARAS